MFSIALANMVTPLIDQSIKGNTFENLTKRYLKLVLVLVLCVGITTGYAALPFDEGNETTKLIDNNKGGNL